MRIGRIRATSRPMGIPISSAQMSDRLKPFPARASMSSSASVIALTKSPARFRYGGGSLRVMLIRRQITQTLRQFATVREVRIAIEGQTEGVLEP